MKTELTMEELKVKGLDILYKNLGSINFIRFMQQFENGSGDFTREREETQKDLNVKDLIQKIKSVRKK